MHHMPDREGDMTRLADRTSRIASSPTMKVTATVDRLRRSGVEIIDFGAGEPDFNTPDLVKGAGHSALDANFTRYTPVAGIADLKKAICDRYKADYGVEYQENQVIATAGGKQALYNTALSLFGPGDEVITHTPCWPTIPEQVKLADATPVFARTHVEDGFAVHAPAILDAVTPRTRGIIINSPGNPTGALIAENELRAWLTADPRLRCRKPAGAFYLFVDISDTLSPEGLRTSLDWCDALLEEQKVAVTPGEAFDAPGTIRISYATSMELLKEGSSR